MLTTEQHAEGRRLLANWLGLGEDIRLIWEATSARATLASFLLDNADALLAEPPAVDVEAIKREAVREFAEALRLSFRCRAEICRNSGLSEEQKFWELHAQRALSEFCNRKGIKL